MARAKLLPEGYKRLDAIRFRLNRLYNDSLEERKTAWEERKERVTCYDQMLALTELRQSEPDGIGSFALGPSRGMLLRLDNAYRNFYRRNKAGQNPGYPRFRPISRMETIDVVVLGKTMVRQRGNRTMLRVKGFPKMRLYPTQELPDGESLKQVRIVRKPFGVYVALVYAVEKEPLPTNPSTVGIDMGVRKRATLSTGEKVATASNDWKAIRRKQRAISRCKKGSGNRKKRVRRYAAMRHRASIRNRNACQRLSTRIIRSHGTVAVEKLNIKHMTRGRPRKQALNRAINEQIWGLLRQQLQYKAEWAGRNYVEVNPAHTSQECSRCGTRNIPGKSEVYNCASCGLVVDRDYNAAVNIMRAGNIALASLTCPVTESVDAERCANSA